MMAYFSNGSEGDRFETYVCRRCVHWQGPEKGCPIFNAHLFYGYKAEGDLKKVLDMLIEDKWVKIGKHEVVEHHCKFFVEKKGGKK
jgi:hypothetical protein